MIDLNQIPITYDDAVKILAAWHGGEGVTIYHLPDPQGQVVKLVEVSASFSDDDELRPVAMGKSSDFPFRSSVLLVSNADWNLVKQGKKSLPGGLGVAELRELTAHGFAQ